MQPDEILPVVTVTTNGAPNYVPTGLTTIGTDATTIPASSLEKFKAPTPKTGETSFTASITSGDKVATGVSVAFDTEGSRTPTRSTRSPSPDRSSRA